MLAPAAMASTAAAAAPLSDIRVCGNNRVPFTGSECRHDQSHAALVASELDCSVRIAVRRPTTLRARLFYQGALQYQYTARVTSRVRTRVIGNYFFHTKMPRGRYSCRFTLGGHHLGVSFHSAGPAGNLLGPAVCLASHRVGHDECPRDEGGTPLPTTNGVTCDAVFARERGRTASIELLDATGAVVASQQRPLNFPITEAGATFTSSGGAFSPGSYECRFSVAGAHSVRRFGLVG